MKKEHLLLIFIKNPEPGKVKTRLAATIGDQKAYKVYLNLLKHTVRAAQDTDICKQVWYSSFIDKNDFIPEPEFEKKQQKGNDLGKRMLNAFTCGFKEGYRNIVIIGSDCPDITSSLINQAVEGLEDNDVVIGPSADGGYYLLGINRLQPELFSDIDWSTEKVLEQTVKKGKSLNLNVSFLPELNDIDTIEDLKNAGLNDAFPN